jgi:hypothetical protein
VNRTMRRRAAIGAAGLAALAAAGGAYAATNGSGTSERQALVNDAARRLHVTPQQLRSALQGALSDRLDAAVAAGRLTRAQADAIKQRAKQHGGLPLLGGGRLGHRHGFFGGLDAAASYLGLTRAQLGQQLRSGKSLAAVARARGKSVDGLEQALVAAERKRLDAAVAAKRITKAQEQRLLSDLEARVSDLVNRTGPPSGGPRWHGRGNGGRGGGPPWGGP